MYSFDSHWALKIYWTHKFLSQQSTCQAHITDTRRATLTTKMSKWYQNEQQKKIIENLKNLINFTKNTVFAHRLITNFFFFYLNWMMFVICCWNCLCHSSFTFLNSGRRLISNWNSNCWPLQSKGSSQTEPILRKHQTIETIHKLINR